MHPAVVCPSENMTSLTDGVALTAKTTFHFEDEIYFACDLGFVLSSDASIVCTKTGVWSADPPTCNSECQAYCLKCKNLAGSMDLQVNSHAFESNQVILARWKLYLLFAEAKCDDPDLSELQYPPVLSPSSDVFFGDVVNITCEVGRPEPLVRFRECVYDSETGTYRYFRDDSLECPGNNFCSP